jgi:hypothetical protein
MQGEEEEEEESHGFITIVNVETKVNKQYLKDRLGGIPKNRATRATRTPGNILFHTCHPTQDIAPVLVPVLLLNQDTSKSKTSQTVPKSWKWKWKFI